MRRQGKKLSLLFKLLAGIWILTMATISILQKNMDRELAISILIIGVSIAAIPLPIDISKIINNITGVKK